MNDTLAHLRDVLKGEVVIGASREVGRIFLACTSCGATVPQWHLVQKANERERIGCRCGNSDVSPRHINPIYAVLWMLYGYLWRGLVRKHTFAQDVCDPRLPWQLR